jgi:hypothetical protein
VHGTVRVPRLQQRQLGLEDHLVEVLLQQLVDVVDAQLLERVCVEDLEAKDVEHADEPLAAARVGRRRLSVERADEPLEGSGVPAHSTKADPDMSDT